MNKIYMFKKLQAIKNTSIIIIDNKVIINNKDKNYFKEFTICINTNIKKLINKIERELI